MAGLVTNLAEEPDLIARVKSALAGELERRQRLLRDAGDLSSISEYHRRWARRRGQDGEGRTIEPLPYLVVVVDEFGELLEAEPGFADIFNAIGRMGRSLGVHLLLATQRLDEGRVRALEPHLRYRLALRTFSAAESRSVLGSPAAYELPPVPGLGYLAVDESLTRFKAAITTLPDRPARREHSPLATDALRPLTLLRHEHIGRTEDRAGASSATSTGDGPDHSAPELHALVRAVSAAGGAAARRIWLAPLPAAVTLGALTSGPPAAHCSWPVLGVVDLPRWQRQTPLLWDHTGPGGNLGVAGAPRTGKSTLLLSLMMALVKGAGPDEVQFYCLDLGGGGLFALEGLPHVGAIIGPGEVDAAARLVHDMRNLVSERAARRRERDGRADQRGVDRRGVDQRGVDQGGVDQARDEAKRAAAEPQVFVVVDNAGMLRQSCPDLEPELSALATTGLHQGVHVVVSANRWFDLRPQLLDALGTKLELRLGDPAETLSKRDAAKALPLDRPGRGITREGDLFQLALPSWSATPGPDGEAVAISEAMAHARATAGRRGPPK